METQSAIVPVPSGSLIEKFTRLTKGLKYRRKSIFPSEMFMFYRASAAYEIDHVIESGVGYGGSTRYLIKLFPGVRVTSIDKNVADPGLPVEFIRADAMDAIPYVINHSNGKNLAVLIDGPKGDKAKKVVDALMRIKRVKVIAVHDMQSSDGINSRDKDFRSEFGHLDLIVGRYLKIYPNGPGLTIFKC